MHNFPPLGTGSPNKSIVRLAIQISCNDVSAHDISCLLYRCSPLKDGMSGVLNRNADGSQLHFVPLARQPLSPCPMTNNIEISMGTNFC